MASRTTKPRSHATHTTSGELARQLVARISGYQPQVSADIVGTVTSVTDGVVRIRGLSDAGYMEMVEFAGGEQGVVVNLEEEEVGVIVLGEYLGIGEGVQVKSTGTLLSVPVGEQLIGRVVSPLGEPLDNQGTVATKKRYPIEKIAPGVVERQPVDTPLQTGILAIDSMIPIGRGQRELIIGDRGVGKTAIALDTIINQADEDVICVYVAIGQKSARVAQVVDALKQHNALKHTIVVSATAAQSAALQYVAPYAGTAMAEYFMDAGRDVLVVYDDLSKHAWAYREISLVLRRPSGREAYPGDVFYLHSRLLERACRLSQKNGNGSITALPIIETQAGDLSAYIPTNVISITDGQIYLESDLFYSGQRPAINAGLSVSRVGGAAQIPAMKKVAGQLRLDLAQYRELAAFAQFSADLDVATRNQIDRGARMVELLKQPQFAPLSIEQQVVILWVGAGGYLDNVPIARITQFKTRLLEELTTQHKKILAAIAKERKISDATKKSLTKIVQNVKKTHFPQQEEAKENELTEKP